MLPELVKYVLPSGFINYFELVGIKKEGDILHLHLDELPVIPSEYMHLHLSGNGFYASSTIRDFPPRDKKVLLHVRRRRWVDESGKSYSRSWGLTADGTRYSKEFACFLKEAFGYPPDTRPIS
ncbi:hypothetical protein EZS27_034635 [termite gut metagenome]|uniref:Transposase n=1 Tax=termite gut metagenome TaxID=433724 RepID=A0A5J4PZ21_9ZZZZ